MKPGTAKLKKAKRDGTNIYIPVETAKTCPVKVGDRVETDSPKMTGIVLSISDDWQTCLVDWIAAPGGMAGKHRANIKDLIARPAKPSKIQQNRKEESLKIGDRVFFVQHWYGEERQFEGVVTQVNDPQGTARVVYNLPDDLPNDLVLVPEIQSAIAFFALQKVAPKDANGVDLFVGDQVTAAWSAGRSYRGTIESLSGKRKVVAHGIWTHGRRNSDGDHFSVETTQLVKVKNLPPEDQEFDLLGAGSPERTIAELKDEIAAIRKDGPVAPDGCWVEVYCANEGTSRHARYNSRVPMFQGKRSGGLVRKSALKKENSPEHQAAIAACARRNRINEIKRQIKALEGIGRAAE